MHEGSQRTLSVGVVGAGEIARIAHLPVLSAMDSVSVAWITDRDPDRARAMARGFKTSFHELPEDLHDLPEVDIFLLAIPYGVRDGFYEALAERESALFVEKPLFQTVEEHRRLCAIFPDYRFGQAFTRRSLGSTRAVKRAIEHDLFGPLRSMRVGFGHPGSLAGNYQSNLKLAGGGMLFDSAIHTLDSLLFLAGAKKQRPDQIRMIMDKGFDLHTEVALTLEMPSGAEVDASLTVSCLEETSNRLELRFEHADVSYSVYDHTGRVEVKPLNGDDVYVLSKGDGPYPIKHFQITYEHWNNFVRGLHEQRANYTSAHDTLQTTELCEACYEAGSRSEEENGHNGW